MPLGLACMEQLGEEGVPPSPWKEAVNPKHRCPLFSNSEMSPFECLRFPCME